MLDIKRIKEDPEKVKAGLRAKEVNCDQEVDRILALDKERRDIIFATEQMKAEQNKVSKTIPQLKKAGEEGRINFVGNIEAREAVEGSVDVIVADGYSGNIFLKTMEGTGLFLAREIKKIFKQNLLTKLAAVMVSGGLKRFKKLMDSSEVGGTALVGISKTVIKAHGSSNAYAFQNAIRQASQSVSSGLIENITANIDLMRLDAPEKE